MKKLVLFGLWAVVSVLMYAQENVNDSIRLKIRDMKLSENYVYAESAAEDNAEGVKILALEELKIHITDYLIALGKTKQEIKMLQEEVAADCRVLMYQRGTVWKSFAYVAKKRLGGEEVAVEEPNPTPTEVAPTIAEVAPAVAEATPTVAEATPTVTETAPAVAQAETPVVESPVAENPTEEETVVLTDPVDTDQVEVLTVEVDTTEIKLVPDEKVVEQSMEASKPVAAVGLSEEDSDENMVHHRIINELMALQTYENVLMYLTTMKEDGRLMYGKLSTLMNPQEAYMVIIKDGQLVTVLGRGEKERTNLKTMQPDMLKNYKGHAVIWLKIFHE